MLTGLRWLAIEVESVERAREFYRTHLSLPLIETSDTEATFAAGESRFILRQPSSVPRGGVHVHFAFKTPSTSYDDWLDRLDPAFDLVEYQFGLYRSLYFFDPDRHCVEISGRDDTGNGITGIFEVVFEVENMDLAESFYRRLGMVVVDRGDKRRRVRLDAGPFDLELWEPQLGLAGARGGVHVDIGLETADPIDTAKMLSDEALDVEHRGDVARVRDPDGHYLTFCGPDDR